MIHTFHYISLCNMTKQHSNLLDISRQLACMKLGSREKYQPIQYCWVHISRLLGYPVSYMPFAYRYPTNLLQHADRTAFALAALMLSCLRAVTIIYYCTCCVYLIVQYRLTVYIAPEGCFTSPKKGMRKYIPIFKRTINSSIYYTQYQYSLHDLCSIMRFS